MHLSDVSTETAECTLISFLENNVSLGISVVKRSPT
jgi:hypothetical protein